jgi:four helix bundle protein
MSLLAAGDTDCSYYVTAKMRRVSRWNDATGSAIPRQRPMVSDFRKLKVWRKAFALALTTHKLAQDVRGAAYLSLRSQLIRAAMSIPANIAEGREQKTERGFATFLRHALASAAELENHYLIARGMGVISRTGCDSAIGQTVEVKKMLHGLINSLEHD